MENIITYVGMDTHKKQHKIALHYPRQEEIVEFTINNTIRDIKKMVKKIKKTGTRASRVLLRSRRLWLHTQT